MSHGVGEPERVSEISLQRRIDNGQVDKLFALHVTHDDECPVFGDDVPGIQSELQALVKEFTPSVFLNELPSGLPPDRGISPVVLLPSGTKPPFGPLYRMSRHEMEALKQQVADLLQKGLITPSTASFGAPCLFATKKDSAELCLVVDYRRLNALTVPNRGTLPRIDDAYITVRGAQVFSAIDLTAGYHQVRLPEEDVPKTSFRTPLGLFQFKVLPVGLRGCAADIPGDDE